jgi:hypothetical protein
MSDIQILVTEIDVTAEEIEAVVEVTVSETSVEVFDGIGIAATGADATYRHVQSSASAVWTVNHNLGKRVSVSIADSAGDQVWGKVNYVSNNRVVITFSAAFSGEAYCN